MALVRRAQFHSSMVALNTHCDWIVIPVADGLGKRLLMFGMASWEVVENSPIMRDGRT